MIEGFLQVADGAGAEYARADRVVGIGRYEDHRNAVADRGQSRPIGTSAEPIPLIHTDNRRITLSELARKPNRAKTQSDRLLARLHQ